LIVTLADVINCAVLNIADPKPCPAANMITGPLQLQIVRERSLAGQPAIEIA
jgi:hypothetical protein